MAMSKMSEVMHLPLAAASIDLEHVIVDGSEDRAVLATCSEPQRSAMIRAVNCHDDMLEALKTAKETIRAWHGPNAWDIYDRVSPEMRVINEAIAKAEGRP